MAVRVKYEIVGAAGIVVVMSVVVESVVVTDMVSATLVIDSVNTVVSIVVVVGVKVVDIVVVVRGVAAVIVVAVTPMHEQALEYRTAPEQADAYVGIWDGTTVTWRFARVPVTVAKSVSV